MPSARSRGLPPDKEVAFEDLVRRTAPLVSRRLRGASAAGVDIESLLQDAYIRALERWTEVGAMPCEAQLAWVSTTAGRLLVDELRKPEQRRREPAALGEHQVPVSHAATDPERRYEARERLSRICSLVARLSPREQDVVIMYSLLGLDYDEVAAHLEVPKAAVMTAMSRARAHLRSLDASTMDEEEVW